MKVAQNVADVLERHAVLKLEGIDRMYLNVYVPQLQWGYGVVEFFREHRKQAWAACASGVLDGVSCKLVIWSLEHCLASHLAVETRPP